MHHSRDTRLIAYILPSDDQVDDRLFEAWRADKGRHVEIRTWDFGRWPAWMDINLNRGEYAWKMLVVQAVMEEFGGLVLWQDAGNIMDGDMTEMWQEIASEGIWSSTTGGDIQT
jgi:hypothetical protein